MTVSSDQQVSGFRQPVYLEIDALDNGVFHRAKFYQASIEGTNINGVTSQSPAVLTCVTTGIPKRFAVDR